MASLNHIGIAIKDLSAMKKLFSILGLEIDHSEKVTEQGVFTHFLPLPMVQSSIEFLEPIDDNGTVAQYINKKGPGIHHISFSLEKGELEPLCNRLEQQGYRLIYASPKAGAHGMKINFIHPGSAGGILIELMELS